MATLHRKDCPFFVQAVVVLLVGMWLHCHAWGLLLRCMSEGVREVPHWVLFRDLSFDLEFAKAAVLIRAVVILFFALYLAFVICQVLHLPLSLKCLVLLAAVENSLRFAAEGTEARKRHLAHQAGCFDHVAQARGWRNETSARDFISNSVSAELAEVLLERNRSFQLEVITTAYRGLGVFVHGSASTGSIVAIYGGTLRQFFPRSIMAAPLTWLRILWKGSHWLWMHRINCCPGCFVDGVAVEWSADPLGQGQFINHPPSGVLPNVMYFGLFNCAPAEAVALSQVRSSLPVTYSDDVTAVAILLTLRPVENEELFADYMLAPPYLLEGLWYEPVLISPCE